MQIQVLGFNRLRIMSALVASLVLIGGCGNGQQPVVTNPSPTVASLNLLGPDFLRIGESADFSIEAVYSDGTRGPMTAQMWECDNPNVAGIAGGRGTGLAPGRAKLYGRCQHGRAEHAIRVVPDYRGSWAGSYVWRSCTASGQFQQERACDVFSPGTQLPLSLRLSQAKDLTTGTTAFRDLM